MKGIYGIKLLLVFLLVFAFTRNNQKSVERIERLPEPSAQVSDSVVSLDEFDISIQELVSQTRWKRNPFLPYYDLSTEKLVDDQYVLYTESPQLERTYRENGNYKAVVSNKTLAAGDDYMGMKVTYIGETLVILDKKNQQMALKLQIDQ
jgi:hypothetical protein